MIGNKGPSPNFFAPDRSECTICTLYLSCEKTKKLNCGDSPGVPVRQQSLCRTETKVLARAKPRERKNHLTHYKTLNYSDGHKSVHIQATTIRIMEANPRYRAERITDLPSDNVVKSSLNDDINPSTRGDRFLILKPEQGPSNRTTANATAAARRKQNRSPLRGGSRAHPWGPDAQGLQEVETQAGDTATMGSSTWTGTHHHHNNKWGSMPSKSAAHKVLERELSDRKSLISKALRLDQRRRT
jgi:hypothetical protein